MLAETLLVVGAGTLGLGLLTGITGWALRTRSTTAIYGEGALSRGSGGTETQASVGALADLVRGSGSRERLREESSNPLVVGVLLDAVSQTAAALGAALMLVSLVAYLAEV